MSEGEKIKDMFQLITNKEYNICYRTEKSELEKWNGEVPTVQGSSTPIIDMTK